MSFWKWGWCAGAFTYFTIWQSPIHSLRMAKIRYIYIHGDDMKPPPSQTSSAIDLSVLDSFFVVIFFVYYSVVFTCGVTDAYYMLVYVYLCIYSVGSHSSIVCLIWSWQKVFFLGKDDATSYFPLETENMFHIVWCECVWWVIVYISYCFTHRMTCKCLYSVEDFGRNESVEFFGLNNSI